MGEREKTGQDKTRQRHEKETERKKVLNLTSLFPNTAALAEGTSTFRQVNVESQSKVTRHSHTP